MGPLIGFALLALIVIVFFLVFERIFEHALKTNAFFVNAFLRMMILALVCLLLYHFLPWFSTLFTAALPL
ncbi:hypothetical protein ABEX20_17230 [Brevibacillus reuszeri]